MDFKSQKKQISEKKANQEKRQTCKTGVRTALLSASKSGACRMTASSGACSMSSSTEAHAEVGQQVKVDDGDFPACGLQGQTSFEKTLVHFFEMEKDHRAGDCWL